MPGINKDIQTVHKPALDADREKDEQTNKN
mgnify:CR=1 FL=1